MKLRIILAGAVLTLGGCDAGNDNHSGDDRGAAAAAMTAASMDAPVNCTSLPDFVPLYADARVETCVSGPAGEPRRESGTVVYTTSATPEAVMAWYKDKATGDGLVPALSTETLFSARDGSSRTVMAMVETVRGTTKVTLNWGRDI